MIEINILKKLNGAMGEMELNVNLEIKKGDFLALYGQSGSGKTTILRILAGLEKCDSGKIVVEESVWVDKNINLLPQNREIGFMFQDYALFPHMTIMQNLLYAFKDKNRALEILEIVELSELKDRYPNVLSGGQKQRVSLARALMRNPKILLLDEPLSALDVALRTKLQSKILELHKRFDLTTILVSHDPSEIYKLSNRVIAISNGKVINDGSPKDILLKSKNSQKFSFEGEILDIIKNDAIFIAIVAIGSQIVEITIDSHEASSYKIGDIVNIGTKAFIPIIKAIKQ
ncbi:MAG: ATP-binding cassette domain-containing protein [Campylobacterales bacterium]|nr:ATP-binding cassette domain-containing protein [Campylobacterales bacterium]